MSSIQASIEEFEILEKIINTHEQTYKSLRDICSEYINYKIRITPQFLLNLDMSNSGHVNLLVDLLLYIVERYKREKESHKASSIERVQSRPTESLACVKAIFDLYKINSGVETLIISGSADEVMLTTTNTQQVVTVNVPYYNLVSGDALLVKIVGN